MTRRPLFLLVSLLAVLLVTLGGQGAARAAHRRVAVLRLEFQGGVPEVGRVFLSQRLIEALAASEFQVFAGPVVDALLKQGSGLENCREATCYRQIARSLGVEYLITGAVQVDKKNYEVVLRLLSGRDGKDVGQSKERCDLCGIKEVGRQMDGQIKALRGHAEAADAVAPARFSIETRPAGVDVSIDGKSQGVTPLSIDLPAGAHKLSLSAAGFRPAEQRLDVESGTNGYVSVALLPESEGEGGGGSAGGSRRPWRLVGWSAVLAGTVSALAGAVVYSLDGEQVECVKTNMNDGTCTSRRVRSTRLEAGLLLGAGAVLVAGGGTVLYLGWSEGRATDPEASGAARALVVGARGRF